MKNILLLIILFGQCIHAQETLTWSEVFRVKLAFQSSYYHSLEWSPDGTKFIANVEMGNGEVRDEKTHIYDATTGEILMEWDDSHNWQWNPDSEHVALWQESSPLIKIWSFEQQTALIPHTMPIGQVEWSPDGEYIAVYGNGIYIWSHTGESIAMTTFILSLSYTADLMWSPNNKMISVSAWVWDFLEDLTPFLIDLNITGNAAWSPDGQYLATVSDYSRTHIWNVQTKQLIKTLKFVDRPMREVIWHPDGELLATVSADARIGLPASVRIWDLHQDNPIKIIEPLDYILPIREWTPTGNQFVLGELNRLQVWNGDGSQLLLDFETYGIAREAISPDGQYVLETSLNYPDDYKSYYDIYVWDVTQQKRMVDLKAHEAVIDDLLWSPNGQFFASVDKNGNLIIWQKTVGVG